ncbi:hypothetical protein DAPPUDRAFT_234037 [Daphnia pulex]|uniref:Uncharacterized protein n=1 Tax=Daphnia pulex TaxID=6669 RepID=E9FUE6_DAPPU|nr:hypothetical protein DAPPUDRAFT_234037 [Daphnia pulex]|eukprot:EFX88935.1 hypothetical protein DAPPUDRAFT_234037 [Daphnia pulex]
MFMKLDLPPPRMNPFVYRYLLPSFPNTIMATYTREGSLSLAVVEPIGNHPDNNQLKIVSSTAPTCADDDRASTDFWEENHGQLHFCVTVDLVNRLCSTGPPLPTPHTINNRVIDTAATTHTCEQKQCPVLATTRVVQGFVWRHRKSSSSSPFYCEYCCAVLTMPPFTRAGAVGEIEIETKRGDGTKRHQTCRMASSNNVVSPGLSTLAYGNICLSSFPTSFYSSRIPIKRPCLFLLARLGERIDIENGAKYYDIITGQNGLRSPAVADLIIGTLSHVAESPLGLLLLLAINLCALQAAAAAAAAEYRISSAWVQ